MQCKEKIYRTGMNFPRARRCSKPVWKDGFCKTHHPESVEKRRAKSMEQFKQRESIWMAPVKRIEKLESVIRWALGEEGDFPNRPEGAGLYWWRDELRKRAGLKKMKS